MSDVTIENNSMEIKSALENAIKRALYAIGTSAEKHAKERLRAANAINTGRLLNSINFEVDSREVTVGTNVEYGKYVELGTGSHASTGGGTGKKSWVYKDAQGNYHHAYPQRPRPFLVPSVADHKKEYEQIIKDSLNNA